MLDFHDTGESQALPAQRSRDMTHNAVVTWVMQHLMFFYHAPIAPLRPIIEKASWYLLPLQVLWLLREALTMSLCTEGIQSWVSEELQYICELEYAFLQLALPNTYGDAMENPIENDASVRHPIKSKS